MGFQDSNKCYLSFGEYYVWVCTFFGLVTALGLWGIGVEAAYYNHFVGYILVIEAPLLTILESFFFINFCVKVCKNDDDDEPDSCCIQCWRVVMLFDNWKKGIFYLLLSIPCFLQPKEVWLGIISGVMLIMCAILYCTKTFCGDPDQTHEKLSQNTTYDRFDEEIEDNILNPSDRGPSMGVADQDEILEL